MAGSRAGPSTPAGERQQPQPSSPQSTIDTTRISSTTERRPTDRPTDLTHHRQLQYSAVLPAQRHDSVPGGHWRIIATGGGNRRHKTGKLGPATSEHEQLTATKTTSSAFPAHSTNKSETNTQINRLDHSKPFEYEFTTSIIARLLLTAFRRAFC